jgi:3-oxoacyl-[acyl-carrier-protein] synthase-3
MPLIKDLYLVAAGHRHGPNHLDSSDLDQKFGLDEGWGLKYLGMTGRRRLSEGDDIAPLAIEAVTDALGRAGWSSRDLDLLVCGSTFVDQQVPPTSSRIASGTNPDATSFDLNACCAGFPYALTVAASMAAWDTNLQKVAVCMAENISPYIDHDDSESSIFFGDAAGVALLQRGPVSGAFEVVGAELMNDSESPDFVKVPRGGYFHHDGPRSYKQVVRLSGVVGRRVLELIGAEGSDVRVLVGHQSSTRLLADVANALDIPVERQWQNVSWAGNQSGAGSLTALSYGWQEHGKELADGDLVLVVSVGAGITAGAVLLRWHA